jgi:hypothetical protein
MSNFITAVIRSLVPIVVGWIVGLLAAINTRVEPEIQTALILSVSTLAASLYYVTVAWLERKYAWFGWLLGIARKPVYNSGDHVA